MKISQLKGIIKLHRDMEIPLAVSGQNMKVTLGQILDSLMWQEGDGNWSVQLHESYAKGDYSVAEGAECYADGNTSHAEGYGTQAKCRGEHASGMFNLSTCEDGDPAEWDNTNKGRTLFTVGNGAGDNARHNALEIKPDGEILISDFSSGAPPEKKPMISLSERVNFQPMTEMDILQIYTRVYKNRYGSLD